MSLDLSEAQLDNALGDEDWSVRIAAAKNPNITEEQLDKALNDENEEVRYAAMTNPKFSSYIHGTQYVAFMAHKHDWSSSSTHRYLANR